MTGRKESINQELAEEMAKFSIFQDIQHIIGSSKRIQAIAYGSFHVNLRDQKLNGHPIPLSLLIFGYLHTARFSLNFSSISLSVFDLFNITHIFPKMLTGSHFELQ